MSADIKEQLAKGAVEIRKAEKEQKLGQKIVGFSPAIKNEKIDFVESTRPLDEIWKERVEVVPMGLKIAENTPIEECLRILDKVIEEAGHIGFRIGDTLNFGNAKYGEKYQRLINQTGRAYSTLAGYAEVARQIPLGRRIIGLNFSVHREIIRLPDLQKRKALLDKVDDEVKEGKIPTRQEMRERVGKLKPKKSAKQSKSKKVVAAYKPTKNDLRQIKKLHKLITPARKLLVSLSPMIRSLSEPSRGYWQRLLTPFANLCDDLA
jgi:hypothetical protein